MKELIRSILRKIGYDVFRVDVLNSMKGEGASMDNAFHRLKQLGVMPSTIIDVGAAKGYWSVHAAQYWPNAHYELIEPVAEQIEDLKRLNKDNIPSMNCHLGVAGAEAGKVQFSVSDDLDGSGVYGEGATNDTRSLPVLTLNSIGQGKPKPFLIKLDTHGYEVPILEGASELLPHTEALIIEIYGFYVSPTGLLFHQLSAWLEEKGFRLYDIVDIVRRKKDNAFWQADAVYLPKSHPIFKDNLYA